MSSVGALLPGCFQLATTSWLTSPLVLYSGNVFRLPTHGAGRRTKTDGIGEVSLHLLGLYLVYRRQPCHLPRREAWFTSSPPIVSAETCWASYLSEIGSTCSTRRRREDSCLDDVLRMGRLPGMYPEARRVEGWLSMLLRQGRLPGTTAMPNRCTKISALPGTVTVTVTVTVNRLGSLGPGCASCGLLYGYYEARRVEGWLSMLLRQGRLYMMVVLRVFKVSSSLINYKAPEFYR